ncbi:unnamed protein product [Closterium sp. NIES-54]
MPSPCVPQLCSPRAALPRTPARCPAQRPAVLPCLPARCPARLHAALPRMPARCPALHACALLLPCPARLRAAPALPRAHSQLPLLPLLPPAHTPTVATTTAPTTAATAVATSALAPLLRTDTTYHGHYHCPTPGGGASRTRRQKPLSPQQGREWAVRWGATTRGTCESTTAGSAASRCGGSGGGHQQQQRPPETLSPQQLREWAVQWDSPGGGGFWGTRTGGVEAPSGVEPTSLGAFDSASTVAEPKEALHTFTLDSGASRCFFRDSTTVTPLTVPVPVTLADPSGGPAVVRGATVLPCPAALSGLLTGLHLPSFAKNLVASSVL